MDLDLLILYLQYLYTHYFNLSSCHLVYISFEIQVEIFNFRIILDVTWQIKHISSDHR